MKISFDVTENELRRFAADVFAVYANGDFDPMKNPSDNFMYKALLGAEKYLKKMNIELDFSSKEKKEEK